MSPLLLQNLKIDGYPVISNIYYLTGCCPNKNSFERSLKRFLRINLGEAEDQRCQLFEPEGRVFKSPGASLTFIKKGFRPSEKGFGQQPVKIRPRVFQ
jgi:hypothetical protein